ncbi:ergothioneine biosynthesis protein EgtB [Gilvimarinus polysaccharolyticus]|uniref:ergothioneine biosynthesis protein EgtB n=1 Tax=Gilvimarinus polysaccharolyticus TaxID=863921 RepID=UPI00067382A6|nr:ergothioneine biosynthesis protein EgtB [Gilvimarinus polysaccharolyticus]
MLHEQQTLTNTELLQWYDAVRQRTVALTHGLSAEDMMLQSMSDASPTKWHLAHTSWFFETFVLKPYAANYRVYNASFEYLFNSYYDSIGERHPRPVRGLLSRPSLEQVLAYRRYIDDAMQTFIDTQPTGASITSVITTGLHHEMQHQELILTDIKHALAQNRAAFKADCRSVSSAAPEAQASHTTPMFSSFPEGTYWIGAEPNGFSYDCERSRHRVFCNAFALSNCPVSNAQWLEFMAAGGYQDPTWWLSDGWSYQQQHQWQAPLYWQKIDNEWFELRFDGYHRVNLSAPVCHISYFEADAFARWANCRLPTEFELEVAAAQNPLQGNFAESNHWHPQPKTPHTGLQQIYGDVWEWTSSSYAPYPDFNPEQGALGEYNGKFMVNQYVLRGGSCATAQAQMRPSYRNFFYPHQRWQFSGLRLAH